MRVIACAGGGRTRLEERPPPRVAAGELLLSIRVSGLCGTDLFKLRYDTAPPGTVLGHEIVGEVVAVGAEVERFALGDRVAVPHHVACGACALCRRGATTLCPTFKENLLAPGGFSDLVRVGTRALPRAARRLPADMDEESAVFLEPLACVLRGIARSGLTPAAESNEAPGTYAGDSLTGRGASAAILGAGSMGLLHLLALRALDPGMAVTVVDPLAPRRELALRLGAAAALDVRDDLPAVTRAQAGGLGADAVFDCVGGAAALEAGLAALRPGGTVVLFAHAAGGERAGFEINSVFHQERRVLGTYSGALAEQDLAWQLLVSGRLDPRPLVTQRLPLTGFEEGVALCRSQRALKVLFVPEAT
jgi:L-iditol 2-dehydrogenase